MSDTITEHDGIIALGEIVRANIEQVEPGTEGATDVGFFWIKQKDESIVTAESLATAIKRAEHGFYQDEPLDRLQSGPSYIELGAWIGDQGLAMALMGLGATLGLWDVVTPKSLGIDDEDAAKQMMGSGFIMIAPHQETPLFP